MIRLSYSEFLVECDDDYKHHVFVRSPQGYDEITNGNYNKDALINDLVYDLSELVKERDKKQYSIIEQIRAEIDKARFVDKDTRICKNALASGLEVAMQIIDKYKAGSEPQESEDKE